MPFSLRLDPATEARIRRLAVATGRSKSAVVRDAMAQYQAGEKPTVRSLPTALELLRPHLGVVRSGRQGSRDTHAKFKAQLERKHGGRRSR